MSTGTNVTITIKKDDGTTVEETFAVYNGESAYDIWLSAGNIGNIDEFLASLKGENGEAGQEGPHGEKGDVGPQGPAGEKGEPGKDGSADIKIDPSDKNILTNGSNGLFVDKYNVGLVAAAGGNINTSYSSDFSKDTAFSDANGVWRYKTTIQLNRVPAGYSGYLLTDIQLTKIPCDDNGTPIMFTIQRTESSKQVGGTFRKFVTVIFIIAQTPTQQMDPVTGVLTPVNDSSGLNYSLRYVMAPVAPNIA